MANDPDVTYTEAILGVWSIVEVNLGIVCGSAMRLKPLLRRWFPNLGLFSSQGKSAANGSPFNSWGASKQLRTDPRNTSHTYQLHSVQKGSAEPITEDRNIRVHREYDITSEIDGKNRFESDTDSTDKCHVPA
ncbi:hypothetical protein B0T16DRAFT_456529 [Cercophora newfieldiana]|uniref:Uncharacterized protein n=1 Tax=Cercophora newfieldiana TaxID=92897 RepID=A0AA40CU39_9PEZI|nr:hypothetical protein B0T16DRAFT_456529 [Cercophora newfieldiana]